MSRNWILDFVFTVIGFCLKRINADNTSGSIWIMALKPDNTVFGLMNLHGKIRTVHITSTYMKFKNNTGKKPGCSYFEVLSSHRQKIWVDWGSRDILNNKRQFQFQEYQIIVATYRKKNQRSCLLLQTVKLHNCVVPHLLFRWILTIADKYTLKKPYLP